MSNSLKMADREFLAYISVENRIQLRELFERQTATLRALLLASPRAPACGELCANPQHVNLFVYPTSCGLLDGAIQSDIDIAFLVSHCLL